MFGWYKDATLNEKRTFWSSYWGWTLDTYDLQIVSFLLPALIGLWSLTKAEAGVIGTAALISTVVGGWLAGILGDRFGRVRLLLFTIGWYSIFGVIAGFATGYDQLLVARTLQGMGFGGEWAVSTALMAEVIQPAHRGKALGLIQSGFSVGWAFAVILSGLLFTYLPADPAWRIGLWIGAVPAVVVFLMRLRLKDSDAFTAARAAATDRAGFATVFSRGLFGRSLLSSLMIAGLQAGAYVVIIWMPTLLKGRGFSLGSATQNILVMAAGTLVGFTVCGFLVDRIGRRATLIAMAAGSMVVTVCYLFLPLDPIVLQVFGALMGLFSVGVFGAVGPFLSELYPTHVRTTCMGFAYNVGKAIGATAVAGVGVLSASMPLGQAIGIFSVVAYSVSIVALLMLPETRATAIDAEGAQDVAAGPEIALRGARA